MKSVHPGLQCFRSSGADRGFPRGAPRTGQRYVFAFCQGLRYPTLATPLAEIDMIFPLAASTTCSAPSEPSESVFDNCLAAISCTRVDERTPDEDQEIASEECVFEGTPIDGQSPATDERRIVVAAVRCRRRLVPVQLHRGHAADRPTRLPGRHQAQGSPRGGPRHLPATGFPRALRGVGSKNLKPRRPPRVVLVPYRHVRVA